MQRCSQCKFCFYCSQTCQKEAWKKHKGVCKPAPVDLLSAPPPREPIAGVRILGGDNRPFYPKPTTVGPDHPVWTLGSISPVSQIVGVPILIYREREETDLATPNDADLDNQSVTYLMIEPVRGFAPPRWQKNIGPVTVVRADKKPLTPLALEMIWMYCDAIIQDFGDGPTPYGRYSPEAFQEFCQGYKEDYIENGIRVDEFRAQQLPL